MISALKQISLLLVMVSSTAVASKQFDASQANVRAEFVRAMNEATARKEEDNRQQSLMKRMLQNAKLVKNAFITSPQPERKLGNGGGNWNYGYYNYYNNYNKEDDQWQQQGQNGQNQQEEREGDDAFRDYGGLNLTQYALKYLGCQNIHSFSDEMAENNNVYGTLKMDRFVVFRLCPKQSCSNYNQYGCDYNYGEYTMPMEDYLVTMQEYHIQQYQKYCQTCVSCMTQTGDFAQGNDDANNRRMANNNYNGGGQYYYYNQDYNGDDANNYYAAGDDGNANDDGNNYQADPSDDQFNNDDGSNATYYSYKCIYDRICNEYREACDADMFTDDNYMANSEAYADYFECAEFDIGGSQSYVGPHCRSDGFTIGIGIYKDEYCSNYVGDMAEMEAVTGQAFSDDYLSPYYPQQCISCSSKESYALMTDDEMDREDDIGLYEVCGALYEQAAKCNRYLGEGDTYIGQYQQEANEYDVCNFVASLVENNYDEYGEAYIESPEWELAQWKQINSYKQDMMERATPGQILGILFSIGLVVVLIFYIIYLRHKLTRRLPWTPGFGKNSKAVEAGNISRVGSGITMQRSLSNLEPGYSRSGSFA